MDAHIAVLLEHARQSRSKGSTADVYVWWGKLRSQYRQAPLPHLDDVVKVCDQLSSAETYELNIYLTDYRSLYVAHLIGVTTGDVRKDPAAKPHIPPYYFERSEAADCWFKLGDIRRLVLDDTTAVTEELRRLRNTRYNDQRVSLYGGMVDLPLVVVRPDGASWFDVSARNELTGGSYWVEFDAERAGTGEVQRDLRDNRFGIRLWSNLHPSARSFIATAEQLYRTHRNDAAFDLSPVLVNLAKAYEVQLNRVVRESLAGASEPLRTFELQDREIDVPTDQVHLGLGDLRHLINDSQERNTWFKARLTNGDWFAASLPPVLEELRKLRNPAAHGAEVDRERIAQVRATSVGVGHKGHLLELAAVRAK